MIIAVDFDGTLKLPNWSPNIQLIQRLKAAQRKGDTVILWTCRAGMRLNEALRFLYQNGFVPNAVNQNTPQTISKLGYDSRKILADIYIDDKNYR